MTGREHIDLRESLLALNIISYPEGFNYSLGTDYRYIYKTSKFIQRLTIYKWRNKDSKRLDKVFIDDIIDGMDYISKEMESYSRSRKKVRSPEWKKKQ